MDFRAPVPRSTLSIIIPVYNEAKTLAEILDRVCRVQLIGEVQKEIVIVNDGSTDDTDQQALEYIKKHPSQGIHYLLHDQNRGKGAAIRTAIVECSGDYLVIQDADLEYNPEEYNSLLEPILAGDADVVYGSRFMGGNPHRVHFFWHYLGNKFLTLLSNALTNLNLTDMETCYKMFSSGIFKSLDLEESRFGFEPEVTAKLAKIPGIRIFEIGISYYGRNYHEGKKIGWMDGFEAIKCIWKYNYLAEMISREEEMIFGRLETPLVISVLLIGAFLRVRQYVVDRSLWLDEAFLSLNIVNRSFSELLSPLDWSQVAPIGFLYLQKLLIISVGNNEMTLRAIPIISGLISMILIYKLTQLLFDKYTALITLMLFSASYWLIFYSNEVKQYSSDVMFYLLTFYLFFRYVWNSRKLTAYFGFGIYGALVIWFSTPMMLVLASLLLILFVRLVFSRDGEAVKRTLLMAGFILAGGISYYLLFIQNHPTAELMRSYWAKFFLPTESAAVAQKWLLMKWHSLFKDDLGFDYRVYVVKIFFLAGLIGSIFRKTPVWILFFPAVIHYIASGFELYPVDTRLTLY